MIKEPERIALRRAFSMTVRTLRLKVGIAQERLATETGTDRGYMSGLERGLHTPSLETIFKLLPVLQVDFGQFAVEFMRSHKKELLRQQERLKPRTRKRKKDNDSDVKRLA